MKWWIAIGFIFFISGCVSHVEVDTMGGKTVSFQTSDSYTIVGTLWQNENTAKSPVILVHQLGSDRHSFDAFAQKVFSEGFTVLSIDLRGHGESVQKNGKKTLFTQFSDADWKQLPQDINAAAAFLGTNDPFIVGASIGSNAALQYAASHPSVSGIILLSPGINYRGLDVTTAMQNNTVSSLIIASKGDSYSANSSQSIFSTLAISDKKLELVNGSAHGTAMFIQQPDLIDEAIDWLHAHV